MGAGDGHLSYGEYAKAIVLYRSALMKTGVDADTVNTRLGIALALSGDKQGARAAFQAVKGPRAEIAALWMAFLDAPQTTA
jgi:Flp pilus assembly protein TadD